MAYTVEGSAESIEVTQDMSVDEEEDLFEIDLEAVNCIPPPHYWESYYTSSPGSALLANCLLPISDISSAVPISLAGTTSIFLITEPRSVGECLRLPFLWGFLDFRANE